MVLSMIPNTILHPVWFLLPLFTAQVLHADADMGGYLLAVTGVGGFMSTLIIASFGLPSRRGYLLLATAAFSSATTMAFAFSSWLPAAFIFLALMSLWQSHYRTAQGIVVLSIVPDEFRARTLSVLAYERGFLTASSILVGMLADATSASRGHTVPGCPGPWAHPALHSRPRTGPFPSLMRRPGQPDTEQSRRHCLSAVAVPDFITARRAGLPGAPATVWGRDSSPQPVAGPGIHAVRRGASSTPAVLSLRSGC